MEKNELSAKRESLFAALDQVLAGHKDCVDGCKAKYATCMNGCAYQTCARVCRNELESCINSCPSFTLDDEKKKQLADILDKIEATLAE